MSLPTRPFLPSTWNWRLNGLLVVSLVVGPGQIRDTARTSWGQRRVARLFRAALDAATFTNCILDVEETVRADDRRRLASSGPQV